MCVANDTHYHERTMNSYDFLLAAGCFITDDIYTSCESNIANNYDCVKWCLLSTNWMNTSGVILRGVYIILSLLYPEDLKQLVYLRVKVWRIILNSIIKS